jgi:ferritin-like metal-binding protein YciE
MIDEVREQLIEYLEDAHALEQHVAHQLDLLVETTEDRELSEQFRHHREETARHELALRERLEAYRRSASPLKEAGSIFAAMSKGLVDAVRSPSPARNARDAYVAEHLEIATYHMLEHLALHAGDWATADVARENRADEEAVAEAISKRWERVVHLSLEKEGVPG